MSNLKDAAGMGVDIALAGVTARIAQLTELHELELQMQVAHAAGEVLTDQQIQAQFDKTDAAIAAYRAELLAARAAK